MNCNAAIWSFLSCWIREVQFCRARLGVYGVLVVKDASFVACCCGFTIASSSLL